MEDELERLSTAEIVDVIKRKPLKFQSVSLSNVLAQLIRRSVIALQDEKEGACKSEKELSALYDEWLCTWILNVLTSMAISTWTLAGASYFLALSTAGASKHADKFRSKLVDVWGIPKLVALLSYQSVSVRFNALLAFGNLLRHCPTTYSEALRLGALRKLAHLFQEAVIKSINILLDKSPHSRNVLLQLDLVVPLLSVIRTSPYHELRVAALIALECACCKEDTEIQRAHFVCNGGVKTLMEIVESKDIPLLKQAIQMLALFAILDEKARQEIAGMSSCLQFLGNILQSSSLEHEALLMIYSTKDNKEPDLVPLLKEHITAIRILLKVCSVKL